MEFYAKSLLIDTLYVALTKIRCDLSTKRGEVSEFLFDIFTELNWYSWFSFFHWRYIGGVLTLRLCVTFLLAVSTDHFALRGVLTRC